MGLLIELKKTAQSSNPANLIAENKERAAGLYRGQLVNRAGRLFDESYRRYSGLGKLLESNDPRDRYKAAITLDMMAKTECRRRPDAWRSDRRKVRLTAFWYQAERRLSMNSKTECPVTP